MSQRNPSNFASNLLPFIILSIFLGMSCYMWLTTKKTFFLFDLPYIGFSLFTGSLLFRILPKDKMQWGRRVSQFLIGFYFIFFLSIVIKVDMQIEGFFLYVMMGVFTGATLHYAIAKVFGPLIFSRGFCGWACWTAMILDLMPWRMPKPRHKFWGIIRHMHFFIVLLLMAYVFYFSKEHPVNGSWLAAKWMITGNLLYYIVGLSLAWTLKDNRAFCKYICPIPVLQKLTGRFSIFKYAVNKEKCISCGACERSCPMNIRILDYVKNNQRILSTECIFCASCKMACKHDAIHITAGFDAGWRDFLFFKNKSDKNKSIDKKIPE